MNLSCSESHDGFGVEGCLYFKLVGATNITNG